MIPTPSKDDTLDFIAKGYDFGKGVWERARSLGSPKVCLLYTSDAADE